MVNIISIENRIFNVPLNIFLFNTWKKASARRFVNSYVLKLYEARRLKKSLRGLNFVQKFGPFKKNGVLVKFLRHEYGIDPPEYLNFKILILPILALNFMFGILQYQNVIKNCVPYFSHVVAFCAGYFVAFNIDCAQALEN